MNPASTPTIAVLQVGPLMPALKDALKDRYRAVRLPDLPEERKEFLRLRGGNFQVVVTSGRFGVGTELMRELTGLQAVVHLGVGHDTTDVAQARERGIAISNTPDVLNDCVADTAVALYLDVLRRTSAADRYVRNGDWATKGHFPLTTKASGKRVGILGLGRIGRVIARRLEAFDCTISYHNRRRVDDVAYVHADSPAKLAAMSDVLIVATSGGQQTEGVVDAEVIDALGPNGYLINIARGSVIDESSLVQALLEGRLGGAGLDVFAEEPKVPKELLALNNVVLLPHLASGTQETRHAMAELTLANLRRFIADGTLLTPIS